MYAHELDVAGLADESNATTESRAARTLETTADRSRSTAAWCSQQCTRWRTVPSNEGSRGCLYGEGLTMVKRLATLVALALLTLSGTAHAAQYNAAQLTAILDKAQNAAGTGMIALPNSRAPAAFKAVTPEAQAAGEKAGWVGSGNAVFECTNRDTSMPQSLRRAAHRRRRRPDSRMSSTQPPA